MDLSQFVNQTLNIPGVQFNIKDNQLNQYDRYTYHFTLSMVGERDSEDPTIDKRLAVSPDTVVPSNAPQQTIPVRKIIIAQSGVTVGLNLTSVSIQDSVSTNQRYKNSVTTEVLLTIVEPYSISLIDQMFQASKDLGVRNWRLAPLFLELEFKGYAQDGTLLKSADFNIPRRVWKIVIVDMESTLTQVGTTYKITAMSQNTAGFLDIYYQIPATQKIELNQGIQPTPNFPTPGAGFIGSAAALPPAGPTTIKTFFDTLGRQLTTYYFDQRAAAAAAAVAAPRTPFLIYTFEIAEEIGFQLIDTSRFSNGRRLSFGSVSQNGRELVISKGISITSLLDDLISSTVIDPAKPWFVVDENLGIIRIPRVECLVRNVGYDSLNNDYVRELVFVVSSKHSTRPVMTREMGRRLQISQDIGANERQRQRLQRIARDSLVKAYPYYYTGRNTEIINLNIVFQNMHVIPLPLQSSIADAPNNLTAIPNLRQEINELQQRLANLDARIRAAEALPSGPARSILLGPLRTERETELGRLVQRQNELDRIIGQSGDIAIFDQTLQGRLQVQGLDIRSISASAASTVLRNARISADIRNQSLLQQLRRREFVEDIQIDRLNPAEFTYIADPRDVANNMSRSQVGGTPAAPDSDLARKYYTTILAQIYDRSMNHLTEIEMEIKGDPYWFGKTNIEREGELTSVLFVPPGSTRPPVPRETNYGTIPVDNQANYYDTDAHFLLIFRGGQIPDPDTGFQELSRSVYFSAVYQAITVTNKFENGMFTQKINAVRDGLINLNGLRRVPGT